MENLKFTQTAVGEFKIDSHTDFCLNSLGNDAILYSNSCEFFILDMLYSCDILNNLPFQIRHIKVPQDKPLVNLLKHVDYMEIYRTGNVLESQELAIDHIFITECSMEPPKARLLQAEFVPFNNNSKLCCILTSYGACDLLGQDPISMEWFPLNTKLNQLLISEVFPIKKSPSNIATFAELRKYIDKYYITSFAWFLSRILYVGTADGHVVAFKYLENDKQFELLDKVQTSLGRISYVSTANNLILVGCSHGQVRLLKCDHNNKSLRQLDYLWSKKDRMACRRAILTYNEVLKTYLVVFCKAAHLLAYRLDTEGCIISNSTLYVRGIKITGIECLTDNEFIITTIMSSIHHITISYPTADQLKIDIQTAKHDMDAANFQILGVAVSKSRCLWSFLLFHNKDYTHQSKYIASTALLNVCKLNTHDSLLQLSNLKLSLMNTAQDLLMSINIDINNNCEVERYHSFCDLNHLKCPLEISDELVQKLQIKYTIIRQIANSQKMKFKCIKRPIELEKHFLETTIQIFHILQRLQYLQTYRTGEVKFTSFQELSVICMQTQFLRLFNNLTNAEGDAPNPFETVIEQFSKVIIEIYERCKFDIDKLNYSKEHCWMCNEEVDLPTFDTCRNGHEIKRCTISYVQLPLFATKYCPNCYARVTNDDAIDLLELFAHNEVVRCTLCRYLLKNDIF